MYAATPLKLTGRFAGRRPFAGVLSPIAVPATVLLGSFLLYWASASRQPGWVDATLILNLVRNLELGVWANVHNLFNLIGYAWLHLFPRADAHFALTMLCALLGSLTVLFMYLAAAELTRNPAASALSCLALSVSLSLWWHSTTIEVYTLNTTLIALSLYFVFRAYGRGNSRALYLAFFFGGLGLSNHVLMGLYVLAFFAVLLPVSAAEFRLGAGRLAALIGCYLAGASLFAALFILHWYGVFISSGAGRPAVLRAAASLGATLRFAGGGQFLSSMFTGGLSFRQKLFWRGNYLFLILLNYPSAAAAFIASGFPRLWKKAHRGAALFFLVGIAAQIVWSADYFIWDMYAFSLPVYVMLALPLAAGIDGFLRKGGSRRLIFLTFLIPLLLYPSFSRWPNRKQTVDRYIALYPEASRTGGLWDPAEYIFNPVKRNYTGVSEFCRGVLDTLPRSAAYWDDESKAAYPLEFYYQDLMGRRPDVELNQVFGLIMGPTEARAHAERLLGQLRKGKRVFVSALVEPEREILNQLYHLLAPAAPLEQIRSKDLAEFRGGFPEFEIVDTPIVSDGSLRIYEVRPRS
jgi:hypothetical protein